MGDVDDEIAGLEASLDEARRFLDEQLASIDSVDAKAIQLFQMVTVLVGAMAAAAITYSTGQYHAGVGAEDLRWIVEEGYADGEFPRDRRRFTGGTVHRRIVPDGEEEEE